MSKHLSAEHSVTSRDLLLNDVIQFLGSLHKSLIQNTKYASFNRFETLVMRRVRKLVLLR